MQDLLTVTTTSLQRGCTRKTRSGDKVAGCGRGEHRSPGECGAGAAVAGVEDPAPSAHAPGLVPGSGFIPSLTPSLQFPPAGP